MIQNVLPLVKKDLRNIILRYFILRSTNLSDYILIQLSHLKDYLPSNDQKKIIEIGEIIEKSVPLSNSNKGIGIINVSRSIIYSGGQSLDEIRKAAIDYNNKINKFL